MQVLTVELDGLTLVDGRHARLAGVSFPPQEDLRREAVEFLKVAVAHGVEVVRRVEASDGYVLWCEPRIWRWYGNDPVRRHFERFVLNEIVVAAGFATIMALHTIVGPSRDTSAELHYDFRAKIVGRSEDGKFATLSAGNDCVDIGMALLIYRGTPPLPIARVHVVKVSKEKSVVHLIKSPYDEKNSV